MNKQLRTVFNALDTPLRLKLYTALLEDELTVQEITELFDVPESDLRDHLDILRSADLIETRKRNGWVFHQARSNPFNEVRRLVRGQGDNVWHDVRNEILSAKRNHLNLTGDEADRSAKAGYAGAS